MTNSALPSDVEISAEALRWGESLMKQIPSERVHDGPQISVSTVFKVKPKRSRFEFWLVSDKWYDTWQIDRVHPTGVREIFRGELSPKSCKQLIDDLAKRGFEVRKTTSKQVADDEAARGPEMWAIKKALNNLSKRTDAKPVLEPSVTQTEPSKNAIRDRRKSQRMAMIASLGNLDSDDVSDFSADDYE